MILLTFYLYNIFILCQNNKPTLILNLDKVLESKDINNLVMISASLPLKVLLIHKLSIKLMVISCISKIIEMLSSKSFLQEIFKSMISTEKSCRIQTNKRQMLKY